MGPAGPPVSNACRILPHDIVCFQEHKLFGDKLSAAREQIFNMGWHLYVTPADFTDLQNPSGGKMILVTKHLGSLADNDGERLVWE